MIINNINHDYAYNVEKICFMFFPLEKLNKQNSDNIVITTEKRDNILTVDIKAYSKSINKLADITEVNDVKKELSLLLFDALRELTGFTPPWGILYGVRPARLLHAKTEKLGLESAKADFLSNRVSPEKLNLALNVMESENKIISLSRPDSFSLYISIPFCPTRCSYCSFVSHSIAGARELIAPYVERLCREIAETGRIAKELNLNLETIYFGGGTPTTLSAEQLDMLLTAVEDNFDLSHLREYTVESGRPDTITEEKLNTLLSHNVGRISINPQTFDDDVRRNNGRLHTTEQTIESYKLARSLGFDNINMDFIAGLNGDTAESFAYSIDVAVDLGVESVTVHNLALKSASYLVTENEFFDLSERKAAADMVDYSCKKLYASGYMPYYMYRQSKSLGNLENVGWAKSGYECLYNVFMMDETHTVLAAGAGAVTKLKNQITGHIDRIYNYKYPYEYINNFDNVLLRKQGIIDFYNS